MSTSNAAAFKAQALAMLKRIESMLAACHAAKLTEINSLGLQLAIPEVEKGVSAEEMVDSFIKLHTEWQLIFDKDMEFICESLPKMYENVYLNTTILPIPIKCYLDLKDKQKAVTGKDEAALWAFFRNMVTASCRHINENREKYSDVPLDTYVDKYNIKLVK